MVTTSWFTVVQSMPFTGSTLTGLSTRTATLHPQAWTDFHPVDRARYKIQFQAEKKINQNQPAVQVWRNLHPNLEEHVFSKLRTMKQKGWNTVELSGILPIKGREVWDMNTNLWYRIDIHNMVQTCVNTGTQRLDRKSTRLNSSHPSRSRMPSSA